MKAFVQVPQQALQTVQARDQTALESLLAVVQGVFECEVVTLLNSTVSASA
jgi:hypothetical protein